MTVSHTRFGRDGTVFEAVIQQAVIGFVGNHQQVVGLGEIGDLAELFLGKNRAGGVVRAVDEQHLGAFARFRAAPAEIGGLERIGTNLRVGDGGTVVIQAITGRRQQHFVAGLKHGLHGQEDGLLPAAGDHDLGLRVIADAGLPLDVLGDGFAQGQDAHVWGVVHVSLVQRGLGGFLDVGGRIEVGAADTENDHLLAFTPVGFSLLGGGMDAGTGDLARHGVQKGWHDFTPR